MKHLYILIINILLFTTCGSGNSSAQEEEKETKKVYTTFRSGYGKNFNDLHDLHIDAAIKNGVGPLTSRDDTLKYARELQRIPAELDIYRVDRLKHSVPFLVPKASSLLTQICLNFRDSLNSKNLPLYRPIITSITRTDDDVKSLSRRNSNASDNSAHRYGTTFDMSWIRFDKINPTDPRTLDDGRLKFVLAQVLFDLMQRDKCYIKHERKQSCFHITVR